MLQLHDLDVGLGRDGCGHVEPHHPVGRGGVFEHVEQLGLHFEGDAGGDGAQGGEEAEELQRVAEAVIAPHHDALPSERPPVPHPAEMVGQTRVVTGRRVTRGEGGVGDAPGGGPVVPAHGGHPGVGTVRLGASVVAGGHDVE